MSTAQTDTVQDWREIHVYNYALVDLPEATRDLLCSEGFDTLGDIDRISEGGAEMDRIRSLPGMIPDAANKIEAIMNSHRAAEGDDAEWAGDDTSDATDADTADATPAEVDAGSMGSLLAEVEMLREHDKQTRVLADEAQSLELQWAANREAATTFKRLLDAKLGELRCHVQSREPGLFNQPEVAAPAETPADPTAEAWRDTTLEQLGITGKIAELLAAPSPPLVTLGAIVDHGEKYLLSLTDVAGIGEAKATHIEDKMTAWWTEHPGADGPDLEDADTDDGAGTA